ncbi:unnamed protein product [Brachionus calyciflorus]|uniref:Snake toxin/toxin-like domain-containing protein n=1 Tax=Brachionus calyciflorus TaxID=104777 RepID=A0A814ASR0_9BILA|nr:unnamed protein product [Brachionus calyciflorus]
MKWSDLYVAHVIYVIIINGLISFDQLECLKCYQCFNNDDKRCNLKENPLAEHSIECSSDANSCTLFISSMPSINHEVIARSCQTDCVPKDLSTEQILNLIGCCTTDLCNTGINDMVFINKTQNILNEVSTLDNSKTISNSEILDSTTVTEITNDLETTNFIFNSTQNTTELPKTTITTTKTSTKTINTIKDSTQDYYSKNKSLAKNQTNLKLIFILILLGNRNL